MEGEALVEHEVWGAGLARALCRHVPRAVEEVGGVGCDAL